MGSLRTCPSRAPNFPTVHTLSYSHGPQGPWERQAPSVLASVLSEK